MSDLLERQLGVRGSLVAAVERDLIGPESNEETIAEAPLTRYLAGILYPSTDDGERMTTEMDNQDDTSDDDGDYAADPAVAMSNVQYPTSCGITFAVGADEEPVQISVRAARYRQAGIEDEDESWRREALELQPHDLDVSITDESRTELTDGLTLYCKVREVTNGARSVTVVLMNKLTAEPGRKDGNSFFQVGFDVTQNSGVPFRARPEKLDVTDEDLESNRLLYREHREFAIGHGCSATWEVSDDDPNTAMSVSTSFLPAHQIRLMESNPEIPDERLTFDRLAQSSAGDLTADLEAFNGGYRSWIAGLKTSAKSLDSAFQTAAQTHVKDCEETADRVDEGIHFLRDDVVARRAFQLANRAMADQMERVTKDRDRSELRWRPFQLAFILLALPSIVDPSREDRRWAELLWFPTGGGKTEAYLGLFAFTVFHRRLKGNRSGGATALMRYTLRLLTTQQFERASRVVMACERLRREDREALGEEPISIGSVRRGRRHPQHRRCRTESTDQARSAQRGSDREPVSAPFVPLVFGSARTEELHRPYRPRSNADRMSQCGVPV